VVEVAGDRDQGRPPHGFLEEMSEGGGATSTATPRLSRGRAGVEAREGGGGCVPQESPVRDGWDLFKWAPRRVCVSSRFAIRGGTAWKSCEGWMGPIPKGTHRRICVSPRVAIRGHSAFCICEVRVCFIPKVAYPRLDTVHAAA
jgi:hypothetical protein